MHPAPAHPHHTLRFYIVLITLVVGAIFVLLLLNNSEKGFEGLTSAVVSDANLTSAEEGTTFTDEEGNVISTEEDPSQIKSTKKFAMSLEFESVPTITQDAKIDAMTVRFNNPSTETILINGDKLELNDFTEDVTLTLDDFDGKIDFSGPAITVRGVVKELSVNKISLKSDKEVRIAFDIDYNFVSIDDLNVEVIELDGQGTLTVGNKLSYGIEGEKVDLYSYTGTVTVDKSIDAPLLLDGTVKGISSSGDFLNLNLR